MLSSFNFLQIIFRASLIFLLIIQNNFILELKNQIKGKWLVEAPGDMVEKG
jgi:hypothetical protein